MTLKLICKKTHLIDNLSEYEKMNQPTDDTPDHFAMQEILSRVLNLGGDELLSVLLECPSTEFTSLTEQSGPLLHQLIKLNSEQKNTELSGEINPVREILSRIRPEE